MSAGSVKPQPPLKASAALLAEARKNCAARLRERGSAAEASRFEAGERDEVWAMRHEVAKLQNERRAGK